MQDAILILTTKIGHIVFERATVTIVTIGYARARARVCAREETSLKNRRFRRWVAAQSTEEMGSWSRGAGWWGGIVKIMDLIYLDVIHAQVTWNDTHGELHAR